MSSKKIAGLGILSALSIVLASVIHFPLFAIAPFLEYDPADIPIFITTFMYGPLTGLIITIFVSLIQGFTVSAQSGVYGIIMHVIATGTFVIVAGNIYKHKKTLKMAIV
ncbi:MAG: ECF transporter S component, partial [Clostridia bacterium]